MASGGSRQVVGRKTDWGGDFEANRIYAPTGLAGVSQADAEDHPSI